MADDDNNTIAACRLTLLTAWPLRFCFLQITEIIRCRQNGIYMYMTVFYMLLLELAMNDVTVAAVHCVDLLYLIPKHYKRCRTIQLHSIWQKAILYMRNISLLAAYNCLSYLLVIC